MANQNETNKPVTKTRVGRFQMSIWRRKRLIPVQDQDDYGAERVVKMARACVQYGRFNRGKQRWENQSIWCNPDELRDLANVLDQLNQAI